MLDVVRCVVPKPDFSAIVVRGQKDAASAAIRHVRGDLGECGGVVMYRRSQTVGRQKAKRIAPYVEHHVRHAAQCASLIDALRGLTSYACLLARRTQYVCL